MNTILEPEVKTDQVSYITAIKTYVDELYRKQEIFGLSLETLELTRRFYNLYTPIDKVEEIAPHTLNQLMSITQHLERNLVQEAK